MERSSDRRASGILSATVPAERELQEQCAATEDLLQQREREIAELNHRISNSLQLASSLLTLQRDRLDNIEARDALNSAIARLSAIGRLHRHLYETRTIRHVNFGRFLEELGPEISASTGLSCEVEAASIEMSGDKALSLAIAVNELVLNAGKHAYDGKDGEAIKIACHKNGDDRFELSVSDGGRGLPDGFAPRQSHGLGLSIVQSTARQLGGELRIENDGGARFTLVIPVPELDRREATARR
jgi:two-component system, sensor histidine kinase PdtaS